MLRNRNREVEVEVEVEVKEEGEQVADDDDEALDEERVSFLENSTVENDRICIVEIDQPKDDDRSWGISRPLLFAITLIVCAFGVLAALRSGRWNAVGDTDKSLFSCPVIKTQDITNESGEAFDDLYGEVSRNTTNDKNEFLMTFRTKKYDGWGKTYHEMKMGMKPFKERFFVPYLKPGMKMYESACGIGLNLLMTLEILQEVRGNENKLSLGAGITVYGNEYVRESVELSEMVLGEGVIPAGNHRGTICTGDSTNLSHVPSNAFDLVYTGYITPLQDPLKIDPTDDWEEYTDICTALKNRKRNDWMGQKLWEMTVTKQRDWYGQWVREMARIAKPGTPVIVEQVSLSYCANQYDWGGVEESFWFEAASENTYNWNINPESVRTLSDNIHEKRYHVFMLKSEDR